MFFFLNSHLSGVRGVFLPHLFILTQVQHHSGYQCVQRWGYSTIQDISVYRDGDGQSTGAVCLEFCRNSMNKQKKNVAQTLRFHGDMPTTETLCGSILLKTDYSTPVGRGQLNILGKAFAYSDDVASFRLQAYLSHFSL